MAGAANVRPRFIRRHRSDVGFGRAILQVLREERRQNLPAEFQRGVAAESVSAPKRAAFADLLPVMPGAEHQEDFVVVFVLRLDGAIDGRRAIDVFLVPKAGDQHGRHLQRLGGQQLVHRLVLPERVVAGMRR